jgi:O-antigen biosynthesis protein
MIKIFQNLLNKKEKTAKEIQVENSPVKIKKYMGCIDYVESSDLLGWVASTANDKPISVVAYINDEFAGEGVANQYRADLQANSIHQGYHAFRIELNADLIKNGAKVEIKNKVNDEKLGVDDFIIQFMDQKFKVEVTNAYGNRLDFAIESSGIIHDKTITFRIDGELVVERLIYSDHSNYHDHVWLPAKYLDNADHLLDIGIRGLPSSYGAAKLNLSPILTPWQYLKESYKEPGFLSLPRHADARYESLNLQMESIVNTKAITAIKNLNTVHSVVVESYENRKKFPPFALPKVKNPEVSIIIPAYNKFELTYHCIASIALAYNKTSYEVILADDCSTDETIEVTKIIKNLKVSKNPENLRFLKSCNRASDIVNGEYIIFLNNDTEVRSFWIDELITQHKKDSTVGLTGSKLLNSDGSLQEAGGVVWGNGQPWNVGRNMNPQYPDYNYVRQVDYLSGAAMCIPTKVWKEVGKFSEELAPAYYEDTDLAFKVRAAGYKTLYVPHSEVVHFEGQSHGTDFTKGLKQYQVINEKTFRAKWFKAFKNNGTASLQNLKIEKDRNINARILVIDYTTPIPHNDAGSYAAIQEIKLMVSLGFKVTFVPENLAHFGKHTRELQKIGVEVLYAPFYTSLTEVLNLRLEEMDAVYITRYYVAQNYLAKIKQAGKKVIFNNADLHFLREIRTALNNGRNEASLSVAVETRGQELDVCRKVDAVLTYTATEQAVISSHILEIDKLHITPWVLEEKSSGPTFAQRKGIAFLGGYNHKPNVEAVEYLVNKIMPILKKQRPDIVLSVYGSKMPEIFKSYETDNIKMVGFAAHLDDVYHNHRVFVSPLLSGAGIKGKVLDSMAYGLPTVLTEVAAEGTGLTHGISTLIAEDPEEWVEAIIKLYDDEKLWNRFAENELALVKEKYSFEHGKKAFKDIFESVGLFTTH